MRFPLLFLLVAALSACAPARHSFEEEGAYDPMEGFNRKMYSFNKTADAAVLRPLAKAYAGFPAPVQTAANNLLSNLGEPRNFANHLLQGRGKDSAASAARFLVNTTIGIGGMIDVAAKGGVAKRENDFGVTVRRYVGNRGAYLMLPLLGPSSVADAPGLAADAAASPAAYFKSGAVRAGIAGLGAVSERAEFIKHEYLLETALDEYVYVRDIWEEFRRKEVAKARRGGGEDNN